MISPHRISLSFLPTKKRVKAAKFSSRRSTTIPPTYTVGVKITTVEPLRLTSEGSHGSQDSLFFTHRRSPIQIWKDLSRPSLLEHGIPFTSQSSPHDWHPQYNNLRVPSSSCIKVASRAPSFHILIHRRTEIQASKGNFLQIISQPPFWCAACLCYRIAYTLGNSTKCNRVVL